MTAVICFLVAVFIVFDNPFIEEATSDVQIENRKKVKEVEKIQQLLFQENGLFDQVGNRLKGHGYTFQMLLAIYSKDDIRVKYILENEEVSEPLLEEVNSIFYEEVEEQNLDAADFSLKVTNQDAGPDW
ncbi:hypothetical protein [Lysinibacillus sp. 3P01SB]|uniref:hypothetical protein n=1 Tax=Lysinibacillus sp. 3P01SB TaxID=3132284 RepID=UPI0039A58C4F